MQVVEGMDILLGVKLSASAKEIYSEKYEFYAS